MSPVQGIKVFGALYQTDKLPTQGGVGKGRNCMHATTVPCCKGACGACC